jgi:hypothetical protein
MLLRYIGLQPEAEPAPPTPTVPEHESEEHCGLVEQRPTFCGHDMVSPYIAWRRTGIPQNTIRKWAKSEGIGEKRGAAWVVSMQELGVRRHRQRKAG